MADTTVFQSIASLLQSTGLGELFSYSNNRPGGWLWNMIQSGVDTPEELWAAIEQTSTFRNEFGVIFRMREAQARGEPVRVPTVSEVMDAREQIRTVLAWNDIPDGVISRERIDDYITRGITPEQVATVLGNAYLKVAQADQAVRDVFAEWFGPSGDSMLAAWFLDPENINANTERLAEMAFIGGMARTRGWEVDRQTASRLVDRGLGADAVYQRLTDIEAQQGLFDETIAERGEDLSAGREGMEAAFDLSGESRARIARRLRTRTLQFSGGGGAVASNTGFTGASAAE